MWEVPQKLAAPLTVSCCPTLFCKVSVPLGIFGQLSVPTAEHSSHNWQASALVRHWLVLGTALGLPTRSPARVQSGVLLSDEQRVDVPEKTFWFQSYLANCVVPAM